MAEPGVAVTGVEKDGTIAPRPDGKAGSGAASPAMKPYLKVFGPDVGAFEYELPERVISIGRSSEADIQLANPRVSRAHATIMYEAGHFRLEDAGSTAGTLINGQPVQRRELRHGDTIQIGMYLLEFRTHRGLPGAAEAAARAKLLPRSSYCLLPACMRLRYRHLSVAPQEVFCSGDTLKIGHGGLLIPATKPPREAGCLEVQLCWPNGAARCYLGEVVGVIEQAGFHWMCVKLHAIPKHMHKATVEVGQPDEWRDVPES